MSQHLALVTGASSGLGAEFARVLARRKINLVLVARRAEPMERLADELRERHKVEVLVQPMDLTSPGTAVALQKRLDSSLYRTSWSTTQPSALAVDLSIRTRNASERCFNSTSSAWLS
jgi:short-subunit dehydrogenase